MGSAASSSTASVAKTWQNVQKTCSPKASKPSDPTKNPSAAAWKTIRVFVSSTFKDFDQEREILVKEVFPTLRIWCEQRRLHLVECDLRWGIPQDCPKENVLRSCLGELDRCFEDNVRPFFINMTSERVGWIPGKDDVPADVVERYNWIFGLSVTEMEIIYAAYRTKDPNALFMLRDPGFVRQLPADLKAKYVELGVEPTMKLKKLKEMLSKRFPKEQIVTYTCKYDSALTEKSNGFTNFTTFKQTVTEFFRRRIEAEYPLVEGGDKDDPLAQLQHAQNAFILERSATLIGRTRELKLIGDYVNSDIAQPISAFALTGGAGIGKTSIMAKAVVNAEEKKHEVFYHFAGCTANSTDINVMLLRLLKRVRKLKNSCDSEADSEEISESSQDLPYAVYAELSSPTAPKLAIFIDAIDQFHADDATTAVQRLISWIPTRGTPTEKKAPPTIRVVISVLDGTQVSNALIGRNPKPFTLPVHKLDDESMKEIVEQSLGKYGKKLDGEQAAALMSKEFAKNPLWLCLAVEELRIFGNFRKILEKIQNLPDDLSKLEGEILQRLEGEEEGNLIVATLCLLETSVAGLSEQELKEILGSEAPFNTYIGSGAASTVADCKPLYDNSEEAKKSTGHVLAAYQWATIYRSVKPFLRPFGQSAEGRLNFCHRSFAEAVRNRYTASSAGGKRKDVWHKAIAAYFTRSSATQLRKIEELPTHLVASNDVDGLKAFLSNLAVFDSYMDNENWLQFLKLWRTCCDLPGMTSIYERLLAAEGPNVEPGQTRFSLDVCEELSVKATRLQKLVLMCIRCCQFDQARRLYDDLEKLEGTTLGGKEERMAEVYWMKSMIHHELLQTAMKDVPDDASIENREISIEYAKKAAEIRDKLYKTSRYQKHHLALTLNRLAFMYQHYVKLTEKLKGSGKLALKKEAIDKALPTLERSIKLFTELGEAGRVGGCWNTKYAMKLEKEYFAAKIPETALETILESERIIRENCGEAHFFLLAVYHNCILQLLDEARNHPEAKEKRVGEAYDFLKKLYNLCENFLGMDNPRSQGCLQFFKENKEIQDEAKRRGDPLPDGVVPKTFGDDRDLLDIFDAEPVAAAMRPERSTIETLPPIACVWPSMVPLSQGTNLFPNAQFLNAQDACEGLFGPSPGAGLFGPQSPSKGDSQAAKGKKSTKKGNDSKPPYMAMDIMQHK